MGQSTVRITIQQSEDATLLTLEGRVAGPWATELSRVWSEQASQWAQQKLVLDLSNVIFADADGTEVLREIYSQARPEVIANTPWTRYLAAQIAANPHDRSIQEL
jgi:anti-anti-sigma regulatory factor